MWRTIDVAFSQSDGNFERDFQEVDDFMGSMASFAIVLKPNVLTCPLIVILTPDSLLKINSLRLQCVSQNKLKI